MSMVRNLLARPLQQGPPWTEFGWKIENCKRLQNLQRKYW